MRVLMRLLVLGGMLALWLVAAVPDSQALPVWWNTYDYKTVGSGVFTRPLATDPPVGELEIHMANLYQQNYYKELYFSLDWKTNDPSVGGSLIGEPVWFSWESPEQHLHSSGIWVGGSQKVREFNSETGWWHLEYSYLINPQPAEEWAKLKWAIGTPGKQIDYAYDFRSKCNPVPEPGSALLFVFGVGATSIAWLRRRGARA